MPKKPKPQLTPQGRAIFKQVSDQMITVTEGGRAVRKSRLMAFLDVVWRKASQDNGFLSLQLRLQCGVTPKVTTMPHIVQSDRGPVIREFYSDDDLRRIREFSGIWKMYIGRDAEGQPTD